MKKPNGYWSYERCKEEASKYQHRSDMQKNNGSAYRKIIINKWYDLFDHMERIGNKKMRLIYVYEFSDFFCYVGLTCNITRRNNQHMTDENSSVYKHILESNIQPKLILKSDYIYVDDAILLEEKTLLDYKKNNWSILNQIKTGNIGSNDIKWNKDNCRTEASKYTKASHFDKNSSGAYKAAAKNNWLDEFFPNTSKKGYWNNKDLCKEESKKYKTRSEFCDGSWSAYNYSLRYNWLDEFFPNTLRKGYWNNKDLCREESKKYKTKTEFLNNSNCAYNYAKKNNWLDEFFPNIIKHKNGYWNNIDLCREESKKYKTRSEFCYGNWSAYNYSNINNWLNIFYPKKTKTSN